MEVKAQTPERDRAFPRSGLPVDYLRDASRATYSYLITATRGRILSLADPWPDENK